MPSNGHTWIDYASSATTKNLLGSPRIRKAALSLPSSLERLGLTQTVWKSG
jgi:hypothetical protein